MERLPNLSDEAAREGLARVLDHVTSQDGLCMYYYWIIHRYPIDERYARPGAKLGQPGC